MASNLGLLGYFKYANFTVARINTPLVRASSSELHEFIDENPEVIKRLEKR